MVEHSFEQGEGMGPHVLGQIREGVAVYDNQGQTLGKVKHVYFGMSNAEANERGIGAVAPPDTRIQDDQFVVHVAETISEDGESPPDELRALLVREGFIAVQTEDVFEEDRYILPSWIAKVTKEGVFLGSLSDKSAQS